MKKLIVANWKMAPQTLAEAEEILERSDEYLLSLGKSNNLSLVICPPFIYLEEISSILKTTDLEKSVVLGAQDIAMSDEPSQTGEVSGAMLERLGVAYVIVGHSERRWKLGESEEVTSKKLKRVLEHNLTPIVCIGERNRDNDFKKELAHQIKATFASLTKDEIEKCIIAYEPVWAISSNPGARADNPDSAVESIVAIQEILNSQFMTNNALFLYGGSVNGDNSSGFLSRPEIGGVLVGGASVKKDEFIKILSITAKL